MNETLFCREIKNRIRQDFGSDCVIEKIHGGKFQAAGISDLVGCIKGIYVAIETKVDKREVTPLQKLFLKKVSRAGGVGLVFRYLNKKKIMEVYTSHDLEDFDTNTCRRDAEYGEGAWPRLKQIIEIALDI